MRFSKRWKPDNQAETSTLPDVAGAEALLMFLYSWTCACAFVSTLASNFLSATSSLELAVPSPLVYAAATYLVAVAVARLPLAVGRAASVAMSARAFASVFAVTRIFHPRLVYLGVEFAPHFFDRRGQLALSNFAVAVTVDLLEGLRQFAGGRAF